MRYGEAYSLVCVRVKVGKGDLREASKAKLLEVGLELKVLRMENNGANIKQWSMIVDDKGKVIEGGIMEAVRRWVVMEENHWNWWGLNDDENGDVYDWRRKHGLIGVVYRRLGNGVAIPVEEGLF